MTQSNLLQLAQAGDADAIAALMNTSLQAIGVSARAVLRDGRLHVLLESERILAPSPAIEFIQRGLTRLGLGWISSAVVYTRLVGQSSPIWVEQVPLHSPTLVKNPFAFSPEMPLEAVAQEAPFPSFSRPRLPTKLKRVSPLTLALLLSAPIVFCISSGIIWFRYIWSPATLQTEVVDPVGRQGRATQTSENGRAMDTVSQATEQAYIAYQLGKTATSPQDWRKAAKHWQQAIDLLQTIPKSDPNISLVEQKLAEYRGHFDHVLRVKLSQGGMELLKTITGGLTPKSVVHSGKGLFFAQNMMYSHTINVYDRDYKLVKAIPDQVRLSDYGFSKYEGVQNGAPVEAAFSPDGQTAWVSNYQMYGAGFSSSASDNCSPAQNHDPSFLYRIGTRSLNIDQVIQVGAVPKYVETTPNNRYVLVSNWCSWDVSVIDAQENKEVRRIQLGPYPRGIAIEPSSRTAYVALMGSYDIAAIDLQDFSVTWLHNVGHSPRHLNLDPQGRYLYATLNGAGQIAKIDLATRSVISRVSTGSAPRSMAISGDGLFLYVVNYDSDTVSKVRTSDMQVVRSISVNSAPIGITYDNETNRVWVASYSGSIEVFQD